MPTLENAKTAQNALDLQYIERWLWIKYNSSKKTEHDGATPVPNPIPDFSSARVVERKIGRTTFIVSTRFNDGKEKDIVSTMSRLIRRDSEK